MRRKILIGLRGEARCGKYVEASSDASATFVGVPACNQGDVCLFPCGVDVGDLFWQEPTIDVHTEMRYGARGHNRADDVFRRYTAQLGEFVGAIGGECKGRVRLLALLARRIGWMRGG